jgi:subtilisin family serine protease
LWNAKGGLYAPEVINRAGAAAIEPPFPSPGDRPPWRRWLGDHAPDGTPAPGGDATAGLPITLDATSNDTRFLDGSLWGMYGNASTPANTYGSQAAEAWAAGATGSTGVVVGVVDSGIDYRHIDLYLNIWLNRNEIPSAFKSALVDANGDNLITFWDLNQTANAAYATDLNANGRIDAGDLLADTRWENGTDDDGNGLADDLVGWDYANNDNDPFDDNGHGTHVAGTIGAIGGNGTGVAGVTWSVQMVPLKFTASDGSGSLAGATSALNYFTAASKANTDQNFVATNNSWSGGTFYNPLRTAIINGAKEGILFVAAAGNAPPGGSPVDTDATTTFPIAYSTTVSAGYEAVVSVAAITSTGALASFSNYGATTVDLAAPGDGILSTLPGDAYGTLSGTSMATPHVTGAVALYASVNPTASAATIRTALLNTTVATASLSGKVATGGRLDVQAMVATAGVPCFAEGTRLLTRRGEVAVEALQPGDEAVTLLGGPLVPIAWIGRRRMACAAMAHPADAWPLRVRADAFAPGQPHTDVFLSPDHAVFADGVLVPVRYLENGSTIARLPRDEVTYFHVELARHDVLLAQGLPAESYLDTGNRGDFEGIAAPADAPRQRLALRTWRQRACAPLCLHGPALSRLRARLAARAAALVPGHGAGWSVHLDSAGLAWTPDTSGDAWRFELPAPEPAARLVSPAFVPSVRVPGLEDHRCLGVPVARLIADGHDLPLDHPALQAGWHAPEESVRWTAGSATLPRLRSLIVVLAPIVLPQGQAAAA